MRAMLTGPTQASFRKFATKKEETMTAATDDAVLLEASLEIAAGAARI